MKLKIKPKLIVTNKKVEQREKGKERKALKAAQLDKAIEKELLERLKQVSDGEIYNYPEQQYQKIISKTGVEDEDEDDDEIEGELEEEYEDNDREYDIEYIEDFEESDDEIEESAENVEVPLSSKRSLSETNNKIAKKNKGKKTRVEIEYDEDEEELERPRQEMIFNF